MIARRSPLKLLVSLCVVVGGLLFVWSAPALAQREHVFSSSFGSEGSGDGQFMRPGELAVNEATGDVYVIDRGNDRVEIFSSTGAYVGQFNGSAAPTGAFLWPNLQGLDLDAPPPEGSIAIDNSTNPLDPSKGDVYVMDTGHNVIDKFTANGAYIGQVTGRSPALPFKALGSIKGVAVDSNGALWVQAQGHEGGGETEYGVLGPILQFNDALVNEYVSSVILKAPTVEGLSHIEGHIGLALDAEGNIYIGLEHKSGEYIKLTVPLEFSKNGEPLVEGLDGEETTGLAVDVSSGDVYVDHETSVAAYGPSHVSIERFGSPQMEVSEGIAVDGATGTVYTANASSQEIDAFTSFIVPDVTTGAASNLTETSATVGGVVDPDGLPVTSCVFEYGTSTAYGQSEPCSTIPSGSSPVEVSAQLKGLERLTKYHYRLKVSNANGSNVGQDRTFVTPEPVVLSEESVSDVSSTSALFSVQVDPGGADTTYSFEYGPSEAYGESVPVPAGDLGAGRSSEPVSVRAEGLVGETTYHVRVVASNLLGTVYGPDETFMTQAAGGAFGLPDGRAWELVSPPSKNGASIEPPGGEQVGNEGLTEASVGGGAIGYYATSPVGEGVKGNPAPFGVTQVLSRRGVGGWSSEDITTPANAKFEDIEAEYSFFSSDLSRSIVDPFGAGLLSSEATERTPYLHVDGSESYLPLVSASNVPPGTKIAPTPEEAPQVEAVTPDLSHMIITSEVALTSNTTPGHDIYEWSGGQLQFVGDGQFGSNYQEDKRNMLSSDGSHVIYQRGNGADEAEGIFLRDMTTGETVEVNEPAPGVPRPPDSRNESTDFQTASADDSEVFFLDEEPLTLDSKLKTVLQGEPAGPSDLYVYDATTGSLTDLSVDPNAGEQANVQNWVLGASEDGSIVYFVAQGKLAEGAVSGADNLYVESETGSSWSAPRLVAVLSEEDDNDWLGGSYAHPYRLTSRVSSNGRYLTFMSDRSLTGYDNRDALSGKPDEEVFLYDEANGALRCVSCNATGARPDGLLDPSNEEGRAEGKKLLVDRKDIWGGRWLAASIPGWEEPGSSGLGAVAYQSRVLSDEGRMFFDSPDALVPQATNGQEDVYEYEPQGVGSCTRSAGCVSLVSAGTSSEESVFMDASETGGDVFFLTAARLTSQDVDTAYDVYDAHVCSAGAPCVTQPVVPPPCTSGDACKAAPSLQPAIFGAPSSATFSGLGNVASSSSPPVVEPKPKPRSKAAKCKSGVVKKGRCVKKPTKPKKRGRTRVARSSRGGGR